MRLKENWFTQNHTKENFDSEKSVGVSVGPSCQHFKKKEKIY